MNIATIKRSIFLAEACPDSGTAADDFSRDLFSLNWKFAAFALLGCIVSALLPLSELRIWFYLVFSGLAIALVLTQRLPIAVFILSIPVLSLGLLCSASIFCWSIHADWLLSWCPALVGGAIAILCFRTRRTVSISFSPADMAAFLAGILIFLVAMLISVQNGPAPHGGFFENVYLMVDTNYMLAFIEQARIFHAYPDINPFLPGIGSSYPALLHCGLAALADQSNGPAAISLWWIFPFLTLPGGILVNALWERAIGPRTRSTATIAFALAAFFVYLRPDLAAYVQTQTLTLAFFIFFFWLNGRARWDNALVVLPIILVAMLVGMHSILGMAAILFFCAEAMENQAVWKKRRLPSVIIPIGTFACCLLYLVINHKTAPPSLDSTPLPNALHLFWQTIGSYLIPVAVALVISVFAWKKTGWLLCTAILCGLGLAYAGFGIFCHERWAGDFAVFNSPRFYILAWLAVAPAYFRLKWPAALIILACQMPFTPFFILKPWTGESGDVSAAFPVYNFIRTHVPPYAACTEDGVGNTMCSAFTGHSTLIGSVTNLFGMGMISEPKWQEMMVAHAHLFDPSISAADRAGLLKALNIDCLITAAPANVAAAQKWLPRPWHVAYSTASVAVWTDLKLASKP